jgi:hypothetical protein
MSCATSRSASGLRRQTAHRRTADQPRLRPGHRVGLPQAIRGTVPDRGNAAGHDRGPERPPTGDGNDTSAFVCRAAVDRPAGRSTRMGVPSTSTRSRTVREGRSRCPIGQRVRRPVRTSAPG